MLEETQMTVDALTQEEEEEEVIIRENSPSIDTDECKLSNISDS
jgi:hypothetical protein